MPPEKSDMFSIRIARSPTFYVRLNVKMRSIDTSESRVVVLFKRLVESEREIESGRHEFQALLKTDNREDTFSFQAVPKDHKAGRRPQGQFLSPHCDGRIK